MRACVIVWICISIFTHKYTHNTLLLGRHTYLLNCQHTVAQTLAQSGQINCTNVTCKMKKLYTNTKHEGKQANKI